MPAPGVGTLASGRISGVSRAEQALVVPFRPCLTSLNDNWKSLLAYFIPIMLNAYKNATTKYYETDDENGYRVIGPRHGGKADVA